MNAPDARTDRRRRLPLAWKLLIPFAALIVVGAAVGSLLIVTHLSARAEASLDQELTRRSVEVASAFRDRELYVLESVNFAANLTGMADAVAAGDARAASRLLRSVTALKPDVQMLAAVDRAGRVIAADGASVPDGIARHPVVMQSLSAASDVKRAALVESGGAAYIAIAAPICRSGGACNAAGVAIAGIAVDAVAAEVVAGAAARTPARTLVAVFDTQGRRLTENAALPAARTPPTTTSRLARITTRLGGAEMAVVHTPLFIQRTIQGSFGVGITTDFALAPVRATGRRLAIVLAVALAGVIVVGAALSQRILRQVRPLVSTSRMLGRGDLSARVAVVNRDELGEVAEAVNAMAEQLEASVETLELRVQQRTEEVRRLLAERTEFFAALSHELRTPLAVILHKADVMRDASGRATTRWIEETGAALRDSGEQLLTLVNDILELARAEASGIDIDPVVTSLEAAMAGMRPTLEGLAASNDLSLTIAMPRLPKVKADPARLREILLNLVDNAVKYTPTGGAVAITATTSEGMVVCSVADTGPGIPANVGELIFEPFFRVKGLKTSKGQAATGLGLALTKRLVEAHGGHIWHEPSHTGGTIFSFSLPAASST